MITKALARTVAGHFLLMVPLLLTSVSLVQGQSPPSAPSNTGEADPLQCWWRTTAAAIRVGETFSVVLTCAFTENEVIKVVPDETALDPKTIQLPPFEVLGGMHGTDLRTADHRFAQYEYRLRIVNDQLFGKDVKLPETRITYRVQSRTDNSSAVEGRENMYLLPAQSIRVLAIVPADASDIRNVPAATFADIEARSFRATTLIVIAVVLFGLAVISILMSLVRLFARYRVKETGAPRLVSDLVVLRGVEAEFTAIQREREASSWTPELAGRALAGFRIASCYMLSRPVNQLAGGASTNGYGGTLVVRGNRLSGAQAIVSGSVTAESIALELARLSTNGSESTIRVDRLKELQKAMIHLTRLQYGREAACEVRTLDQSLAAGVELARQLAIEHKWTTKKGVLITEKMIELRKRVWDR